MAFSNKAGWVKRETGVNVVIGNFREGLVVD